MFIVLFVLMLPNLKIDIESEQLFSDFFYMYKVGTNYLVVDSPASQMVMFSSKGEPIASYRKKGRGPNELYKPRVIGIYNDQIYICTNHKHVIRFDHNLQLLDSSDIPMLPVEISSVTSVGTANKNGEFFLAGKRSSEFALIKVGLKEKKWEIIDKYFQQDLTMSFGSRMLHFNKCTFHGNVFMLFKRGILISDENYTIKIFNAEIDNGLNDSSLEFLAPLEDDYPRYYRDSGLLSNFSGFIDQVITTKKNGYIVQFYTWNEESRSEKFYWWDFFDQRGQWIKREKKDKNHLIPVMNTNESFELNYINGETSLVLLGG